MNPLTGLYGAGTRLRNSLFERGVLRTRRLEKPVISVGNLSTGGSGKTPFVIALGELLKQRGISFDVLSRGYRRKTHGTLIVDPTGTAADYGDEPLLIARRLSVPVIVGERRFEGGRLAEQRFQSDLHLLDDGFQHRSLARDCDIVLLAAPDLDDQLLPFGRLREPIASLARAHAIVVPEEVNSKHLALPDKPLWRMRREIDLSNPPANPIAFCGIAKPQQFFAQLRAAGIMPAAEIAFRDHYAYDLDDIQHLRAAASHHKAGGFITTEKDAVNLGGSRSGLDPLSIVVLHLTLDRPADFLDFILRQIGKIST